MFSVVTVCCLCVVMTSCPASADDTPLMRAMLPTHPDIKIEVACAWRGITCDTETSNVTGIDLSDLPMEGTVNFAVMPPALKTFAFRPLLPACEHSTNFADMRYCQLRGTNLNSSTFPLSLTRFDIHRMRQTENSFVNLSALPPALAALDLGYSNATVVTNLPLDFSQSNIVFLGLASILNLFPRWNAAFLPPKIVYLDLSGCGIKETVHLLALPPALQHLFLSNNNGIIDVLPDLSTGNISGLITLYLDNCIINGFFVSSQMPRSLTRLVLSGNNLTGCVDASKLPENLAELDLAKNHLSCAFDFPSLPQSLVSFDMSDNAFTGPVDWRTLPKSLSVLDISFNKFTGPLQMAESMPSKLTALYLMTNLITGPFNTSALKSCRSLRALALYDNQFTGPFSLKPLSSTLMYLQLSRNQFDGSFVFEDVPKRVYYLTISKNRFSGPVSFKSFPPLLTSLDISGNNFSGPILSFPPNVWSLDLSDNMFSGPLTFLVNSSNVMTLNIARNKFCGKIILPKSRFSSRYGYSAGTSPNSSYCLSSMSACDGGNGTCSASVPDFSVLQCTPCSHRTFTKSVTLRGDNPTGNPTGAPTGTATGGNGNGNGSSVPQPPPQQQPTSGGDASAATLMIGIIIAVVVVLAAGLVCGFCIYNRRSSANVDAENTKQRPLLPADDISIAPIPPQEMRSVIVPKTILKSPPKQSAAHFDIEL